MRISDDRLREILISGHYISEEDSSSAEKEAKARHVSLGDYLLAENLFTKDLLGQAIAESFGVLYSDLNSNIPSREQTLRIPEGFAKKSRAVLFSENDEGVTIATDNPGNKNLEAGLKQFFPAGKIAITYSLPEDIDASFVHYQKPLETRFSKIIENQTRIAPEILGEIFEDAYTFHASDIHFEPQKREVVVRFRVDGVLREAGRIPREHYENILNRIKVESRLRIDEHLAAQDGSMRYESTQKAGSGSQNGGNLFDLRTSIVPTVEGEKVVLRVLTTYIQGLALPDLGLSSSHQDILKAAAQKPFGMILVTGPTGSGKTTTLYAVLRMLHKPEVNITTIEDPVEYKIVGVNQIQVNQQTDLTFANGLRSIVRQDPDIILVGEIRDEETAEIAVNAALTGHLLLSTFHANDAATAVPRLLDMGVEPFLLASTLEVIIAQRLVRKICESCRYSVSLKRKDFDTRFPYAKNYFKGKNITIYAGKGCNTCNNSGYYGRTAIFEFIRMTEEMEELILKHPSTTEVWNLARSQGSMPLFEDGIEKVRSGITTPEELMRVAPPPQ